MVTYEEKIEDIENELRKRRHKWTLAAVAYMDYDDVCQIIRLHIFNKLYLYDESLPFKHWVNSIISNQIINLLRNLYLSIAKPCVACAASEDDNRCRIYSEQCAACPLYAKWEKSKKSAYDIKLPVSIESHTQSVSSMPSEDEDLEKSANVLHARMKEVLNVSQFKVYKLLYIDHLSETEAAEVMGYKSSENRVAGYRSICLLKKLFIEKAKKIIGEEFY